MNEMKDVSKEETTLLKEENRNNTDKAKNDINRTNTVKGLTSALLWVLFMVVSTASVQLLEERIPHFELNTFRCATPLLISFIKMIVTRNWPVIEQKEIVSVSLYCLLSLTFSITMFVAATLLPLASVQSVMQTSNIASGIILFYICLDDKPTCSVLMSAFLCICGVTLVIQPNFIFGDMCSSRQGDLNSTTVEDNNNQTRDLHTSNSTREHLIFQAAKYVFPVVTG